MALKRVAITVFCAMVLSCAKAHPVQPTPTTWNIPMMYRHCQVRETVRWGPPKGGWTVTLYCPDGVRLVDYQTGEQVEFIPKAEIGK